MCYVITAYSEKEEKRIELFTWCRANVQQGIDRAMVDAKLFGRYDELSKYQAEPISIQSPYWI